jgi:transcriptional regulator with XRE-family HTH domain
MTKHRLPWEPLPEPDPATLAGRIVIFRRNNGLSQRDLAEKLGCSTQNVSLWETGHHEPGKSRLRQLAKLFDVPLEELRDATAVSEAIKTVRKLQESVNEIAPEHCDVRVTTRENICIMRVNNTDALEPCCYPKDHLLVDTSLKQPNGKPDWYVVSDRFVMLVRQVVAIDEAHYRLTSCNAAVAPREVSVADVTILGRVIGKVQML